MNLLTFLKNAQPENGITVITKGMRKFITNPHAKRELSNIVGAELAKTLYSTAQPEIDRVSAIIARVQVAIDYSVSMEAVADYQEVFNDLAKNDFFVTGQIINFAMKNKQYFAYDDYQAFDITETIMHCADDDTVMFQSPFILYPDGINPSLAFAWPDEGSAGGLASVVYVDKPKRKAYAPKVGFSKYRYIYTSELNLTASQITQNIIDEVARGETPLTGGGLPGWD